MTSPSDLTAQHSDLVVQKAGAPPPAVPVRPEYAVALRQEIDDAREYQKDAYAPKTRTAYRKVWQDFLLYCAQRGLLALPARPETVCTYLAHLAKTKEGRKGPGQAFATIEKTLSIISAAHKAKGAPSPRDNPLVRSTLKGIANKHGRRQDPVDALRLEVLKEVVGCVPSTLTGVRDRAVLVLSYGGAFRRSELSALNVGDIDWKADKKRGIVAHLRKSKTDQQGKGIQKPIRYGLSGDEGMCPVKTLQAWLEASGGNGAPADTPVFRAIVDDSRVTYHRLSADAVYRIVRKYVKISGVEGRYGAHSLRAGFVTDAAAGRAQVQEIMKKTGHRSADTVLRYIRDAELFDNDAAEKTGL
jgi:integrase